MKLVQKLATGLVVAALFATYAQAQVMRVHVPFNFHAGSTMLPAGDYQVRSVAGTSQVWLVAADASTGCALPIRSQIVPTKSGQGKLVFRSYGSSYFLARVENPGLSNGADFHPSKAEKEMAKIDAPREVALYQGVQ